MANELPTDVFSQTLRQVEDDPGAHSSISTLRLIDFYGKNETWVVQTSRRGNGQEVVFIDRNRHDGYDRILLPAEVTKALARQRDQVAASSRRQAGHRLVALRKQRGDKLGNPEALKRARGRRKAVK